VKLKDIETMARTIVREVEIEANLSVTVAYLKYSDRQLTNKERKRQKLLQEFDEGVISYQLGRFGLTRQDFMRVLESKSELKKQYERSMQTFDQFKDRKPEQLDVYISKFNPESMKTIYKKYLAYLRYLTYHQTKTIQSL
jgi:hypothetical protein